MKLDLPRFTLLFSPTECGQRELADAISNRDPDLSVEDLEEPIRDFAQVCFYGSFSGWLDLTSIDERKKEFTRSDGRTYEIEQFLRETRLAMTDKWGPSFLAECAVRRIEAGIPADRFIFRDVQETAEVQHFIDTYSADDVLVIHLDELRFGFAKVQNIWLPSPALDSRLKLLERELSA